MPFQNGYFGAPWKDSCTSIVQTASIRQIGAEKKAAKAAETFEEE
jgi:hypothetical protein